MRTVDTSGAYSVIAVFPFFFADEKIFPEMYSYLEMAPYAHESVLGFQKGSGLFLPKRRWQSRELLYYLCSYASFRLPAKGWTQLT